MPNRATLPSQLKTPPPAMASPLTTASPAGPPSSTLSPRARARGHHPPTTGSTANRQQAYAQPQPQPHPGPQSLSLSQSHGHYAYAPPPPASAAAAVPQANTSHASQSYYHHHHHPPAAAPASAPGTAAAPAFTAVAPPPSHSHLHYGFSQRPLTLDPMSTAAPQSHHHPNPPSGAPPPPHPALSSASAGGGGGGPQLHHHHHHYSYPPHLDPADASVLSGPPAQTTRFLAANWHSARTAGLNLDDRAGGKGAQVPVQRTPQTLKRHDFVQALVATAAEIIDALYPTPPTVVIPLPTFIAEILRRSKSSFSTLQLALFYLFKYRAAFMRRMALEAATRSAMQAAAAPSKDTDSALPSPPTLDASPPISAAIATCMHPPSHDPSSTSSHNATDTSASGAPGVRSLATCGRRLFLAALILAAKYLQDKNYSNKAWAKISGLTALEINRNEREFLDTMDYGLFVSAAKFARWSALLVSHINAVHHARQEQLAAAAAAAQAKAQAAQAQQAHQQQRQTPAAAIGTLNVSSRPASRMSTATPPPPPVSAIITHKAILAFDFLPPQATPPTAPGVGSGAPAPSSSNGSRSISRTGSPVASAQSSSAATVSAATASGSPIHAHVSTHGSPSRKPASFPVTHPRTTAVPYPPPTSTAPAAGTPAALSTTTPHITAANLAVATSSATGSPSTFIVSGAPSMGYMSHSMMASAVNLRDSLPRHMRARPATETLSPENKDAGGVSPLVSAPLVVVGGHLGLIHSAPPSTTPVMPPPSAEARIQHVIHGAGSGSGGLGHPSSGSGGAGTGTGGSGSADRVAAILHAFPDDEIPTGFDYHHAHVHAHAHVHSALHAHAHHASASSLHNTPGSAGSVSSSSAAFLHATSAHFAHAESAASLVSDVAGGLPAVVVPFDAGRQAAHGAAGAGATSDDEGGGGGEPMDGVVGPTKKRNAGDMAGDGADGVYPAAKRQRPSADRAMHQLGYPVPVSHAAAVYAPSTFSTSAALPPPVHPQQHPTTSASASATWTGLSSVHLATYAPPPIEPSAPAPPSRFADLLRMRAAQAAGGAVGASAVGPHGVSHALGGPLSAAMASASAGSEAARRYHAHGQQWQGQGQGQGQGEPPDAKGSRAGGGGQRPSG